MTKKCNIECRICSQASGPQSVETMAWDDLTSYVDQVAEMPKLRTLNLSGGEPLLFFEEVLEVLRYASSKGLRTSCMTNAFWAESEQKAVDVAKALRKAGLVVLVISADSFHQQHISLAHVRNALIAAMQTGINAFLFTVVTRRTKRLHNILEELNDIGTGAYETACLPVGRARDAIPSEEFFLTSEVPTASCIDLSLSRPTVETNGDVFACFSQAGLVPPLKMGSLKEKSLVQIMGNPRNEFLLRILQQHGPAWFLPALEERGVSFQWCGRGYVNVCHLCYEIFSDPRAASVAQEVAELYFDGH